MSDSRLPIANWAGASGHHHQRERCVAPSPREARAGRGLGRGVRFCARDVDWMPLSLSLSPLLRRGEREWAVCDGGRAKLLPTALGRPSLVGPNALSLTSPVAALKRGGSFSYPVVQGVQR